MSTFATRLKKMRHLSRIVAVPIGVNILGLAEIFAFIGLLALANYLPHILAIALLCVAYFGIIALDLWWRLGQPERSHWVRLFSLFTGGCFVFLPIWLIFIGGFVGGVILVVVNGKPAH